MPTVAQKVTGVAGGNIPGIGQITPSPTVGSKARLPGVAVGQALLVADGRETLAVLSDMGDNAPRVTGGYAQWATVARRGTTSLTHFTGNEPLTVDLELFLDAYQSGTSVEQAALMLEAMAGRGKLRAGATPPLLILDTAGVFAHDVRAFPGTRWVVTNLEWDDDGVIVNEYGNRMRAPVTVSLMQHAADDRLVDRAEASARARREQNTGSRKVVVAKKGQTLISIARDRLGDGGKWTVLAKLNGIRDPRSIKAGQRIRLP